MTAVTLEEIERDLKSYLDRAHAGETILVFLGNRPLVEIKPASGPIREPRPFGLCEGEFTVPEDFDEPLPDDVLASFEGR